MGLQSGCHGILCNLSCTSRAFPEISEWGYLPTLCISAKKICRSVRVHQCEFFVCIKPNFNKSTRSGASSNQKAIYGFGFPNLICRKTSIRRAATVASADHPVQCQTTVSTTPTECDRCVTQTSCRPTKKNPYFPYPPSPLPRRRLTPGRGAYSRAVCRH